MVKYYHFTKNITIRFSISFPQILHCQYAIWYCTGKNTLKNEPVLSKKKVQGFPAPELFFSSLMLFWLLKKWNVVIF